MKQGQKVEGEGKACVLPPEALDLPFGKLWGPAQANHLSCFLTCTACILPEALRPLYILLLTIVHPGWFPNTSRQCSKVECVVKSKDSETQRIRISILLAIGYVILAKLHNLSGP